jgi:hypothetical protein
MIKQVRCISPALITLLLVDCFFSNSLRSSYRKIFVFRTINFSLAWFENDFCLPDYQRNSKYFTFGLFRMIRIRFWNYPDSIALCESRVGQLNFTFFNYFETIHWLFVWIKAQFTFSSMIKL